MMAEPHCKRVRQQLDKAISRLCLVCETTGDQCRFDPTQIQAAVDSEVNAELERLRRLKVASAEAGAGANSTTRPPDRRSPRRPHP